MKRLKLQGGDSYKKEAGQRVADAVQLARKENTGDHVQAARDHVAGHIEACHLALHASAGSDNQVGLSFPGGSQQERDHLRRMLQVAIHDARVF
jgi:hypothetical protein